MREGERDERDLRRIHLRVRCILVDIRPWVGDPLASSALGPSIFRNRPSIFFSVTAAEVPFIGCGVRVPQLVGGMSEAPPASVRL